MPSNHIFKPIPLLANQYEINSDGSVVRNATTKEIVNNKNSEITVPVQYKNKPEIIRTVRISKLVANAWLGPCPPGYQLTHLDSVIENNDINNLKYIPRPDIKIIDHTISKNAQNIIKVFTNNKIHVFDDVWTCAKFFSKLFGGDPKNKAYRLTTKRPYIHGCQIQYLSRN